MLNKKEYIGDGINASYNGHYLVLDTLCENKPIYLSLDSFEKLCHFLEKETMLWDVRQIHDHENS